MKFIKKNREDIKEMNLMIINIIYSFPIEELMKGAFINEDVIMAIKKMSYEQIFKLVEINQILILPDNVLIENYLRNFN